MHDKYSTESSPLIEQMQIKTLRYHFPLWRRPKTMVYRFQHGYVETDTSALLMNMVTTFMEKDLVIISKELMKNGNKHLCT